MREIAIIRGDGIGPEIAAAAMRVIDAARAGISWREVAVGQAAKQQFGTELPWQSLEALRHAGAVLKGPLIADRATGGVAVPTPGGVRHYPSVNNGLRRELGVYANVRPVRTWEGVAAAGLIDAVIVREVTEDVYIGVERQVDDDCAEAVKRITGSATRRIARFACEYASKHRRRKITAVHKANVLHLTDGLFLRTVREVVEEYPHLAFDDRMVDAACYLLLKDPAAFDVLVLPNQYGDILSDLAAGIAGSLGLAPGANIGDEVAMFEAAHGAAPDIAGRGIANPVSLILSGALLLDHLGETAAAARVRAGVAKVLRDGRALTPDLGGSATTEQITGAICAALG